MSAKSNPVKLGGDPVLLFHCDQDCYYYNDQDYNNDQLMVRIRRKNKDQDKDALKDDGGGNVKKNGNI